MPLRIGCRKDREHYHGVLGAVGVVSTPGARSPRESFNCLPYCFSEGSASFGKLSKSERFSLRLQGRVCPLALRLRAPLRIDRAFEPLCGNLVDPASSHMLVSKIKPCMCVYTFQHNKTANCSLTQLLIMWLRNITWISSVIL